MSRSRQCESFEAVCVEALGGSVSRSRQCESVEAV